MDDKKREIYAQHHKDRVDLNEQQANIWGHFLKRKEQYSQKYGAGYADILLKKEREELETSFTEQHQQLDQDQLQQWDDYFEGETPSPQASLANDREKESTSPDSIVSEEQTQQPNFDRMPIFLHPLKQRDGGNNNPGRDLDQSQELMNGMRSRAKEQPQQERPVKTEVKPTSMSSRFLQSLSSSRINERPDKSVERSRGLEPEKD